MRDIKFLEGGTSRARPAPAVSWCRAGVAGELGGPGRERRGGPGRVRTLVAPAAKSTESASMWWRARDHDQPVICEDARTLRRVAWGPEIMLGVGPYYRIVQYISVER